MDFLAVHTRDKRLESYAASSQQAVAVQPVVQPWPVAVQPVDPVHDFFHHLQSAGAGPPDTSSGFAESSLDPGSTLRAMRTEDALQQNASASAPSLYTSPVTDSSSPPTGLSREISSLVDEAVGGLEKDLKAKSAELIDLQAQSARQQAQLAAAAEATRRAAEERDQLAVQARELTATRAEQAAMKASAKELVESVRHQVAKWVATYGPENPLAPAPLDPIVSAWGPLAPAPLAPSA